MTEVEHCFKSHQIFLFWESDSILEPEQTFEMKSNPSAYRLGTCLAMVTWLVHS